MAKYFYTNSLSLSLLLLPTPTVMWSLYLRRVARICFVCVDIHVHVCLCVRLCVSVCRSNVAHARLRAVENGKTRTVEYGLANARILLRVMRVKRAINLVCVPPPPPPPQRHSDCIYAAMCAAKSVCRCVPCVSCGHWWTGKLDPILRVVNIRMDPSKKGLSRNDIIFSVNMFI